MSHIATQGAEMTEQAQLFPGIPDDVRRTAVEADINAAGGQQIVGHELGLDEDPVKAGKILSNRINCNGRHRLTDEDVWSIKQLARAASGRSRIHELENDILKFEGKWLTPEDIKARRRKRKQALLAELLALENETE